MTKYTGITKEGETLLLIQTFHSRKNGDSMRIHWNNARACDLDIVKFRAEALAMTENYDLITKKH